VIAEHPRILDLLLTYLFSSAGVDPAIIDRKNSSSKSMGCYARKVASLKQFE